MGIGGKLARETLHSGVFLTIQRYFRAIRRALSEYEVCMNLRAGHKKTGAIRLNPPACVWLGNFARMAQAGVLVICLILLSKAWEAFSRGSLLFIKARNGSASGERWAWVAYWGIWVSGVNGVFWRPG